MGDYFSSDAQFSLAGKTAIVTGASSGIGRGLGRGLAAAGASVVAAARRLERLEDLVREIEDAGGDAVAVRMDVTDPGSVSAAFEEAQDRTGLIDVVINNAGVGDGNAFLDAEPGTLDFV
ncbi:MAG: SDR family NAD(P)-dependent oxidoreductase, partial [Pseudomonadota bacterium]